MKAVAGKEGARECQRERERESKQERARERERERDRQTERQRERERESHSESQMEEDSEDEQGVLQAHPNSRMNLVSHRRVHGTRLREAHREHLCCTALEMGAQYTDGTPCSIM